LQIKQLTFTESVFNKTKDKGQNGSGSWIAKRKFS